MKLSLDQQIDLDVRSLGSSGEGVGTYEGFIVFVEGALPDEKIRVSISEVKKKYARGKLLFVLRRSPNRVTPACPIFEKCGGCQLMHLNYPTQLSTKHQTVLNALQRIGHFKEIVVDPCVSSPQQLSYRNKIQLPVVLNPEGVTVGLYARQSHTVIPVEHCYIHGEQGEKVSKKIISLLKKSGIPPYQEELGEGIIRHLLIKTAVKTKEILVILVTSGHQSTALPALAKAIKAACPEVKGIVQNINRSRLNTVLGNEWKTLEGVPYIQETICDKTFRISPSAFSQVNPAQAESIYQYILELAELDSSKTFLDAFCGVGVMAILAAAQAKLSIGIECVPQAIEDARCNAELNELTNCLFYCDQAESKIHALKNIDVVFLNPPRKGCEESLLRRIKELKAQSIIYMSCDPATLARDLKILAEEGYKIERVTPFDMFPQTSHVECVVKLVPNA